MNSNPLRSRFAGLEFSALGNVPMRPAVPLLSPVGGFEPLDAAGNRMADFKNIRLTHINPQLDNAIVREILMSRFRPYGPMNVQVVKDGFNRSAYVNFDNPIDARNGWLEALPAVCQALGPGCSAEPAGVIRSRGFNEELGRRANWVLPSALEASPKPAPIGFYDEAARRPGGSKEDAAAVATAAVARASHTVHNEEKQSVRILFIGRLKNSITEEQLKSAFERFGPIESVVIKRLGNEGLKTYSFLRFENAKMAREAKVTMTGYQFDGVPCSIGYGKATPTRLLWVYGLGAEASTTWLSRMFSRYGEVERILTVASQEALYVMYAKVESAAEACQALKGQLVEDGQSNCRLEVDFVDENVIDKYTGLGKTITPADTVGIKHKIRRSKMEKSEQVSGTADQGGSAEQHSDHVNTSVSHGSPKDSSESAVPMESEDACDSEYPEAQNLDENRCSCSDGATLSSDFTEETLRKCFAGWSDVEGMNCDVGAGYESTVSEQSRRRLMEWASSHLARTRDGDNLIYDSDDDSENDGSNKRRRSRSNSSRSTMSLISNDGSDIGSHRLMIKDLNELVHQTELCWEGKVAMKKNSCNGQLYLISGCRTSLHVYLYSESGEAADLTISHRFRYKDDVGSPEKWASIIGAMFLLFIPCYPLYSDLKPDELETDGVREMVSLLSQREVAGVAKIQPLKQPFPDFVVFQDSTFYMFPYCDFSSEILKRINPMISVFESNKTKSMLFVYLPKSV